MNIYHQANFITKIPAILNSMRTDLYQEHAQIEKNHWWHRGKKKTVFGLINKYLGENYTKSLDVGCGVGVTVEKLSEIGEAYGIDNSPEAIRLCKKRGIKNVELSLVEKMDHKSGYFDLVTALDIIEHTKSDKLAIKEIKRVLKREGLLIVTVPAYKFLWSYWDEILHHKRRYKKNELKKLLEKNGFEILKLSYANFFIFFPVIIFRLIKKIAIKDQKIVRSDFLETPAFLNPLFKLIYLLENIWIKQFSFPFGLSIICVAKKV